MNQLIKVTKEEILSDVYLFETGKSIIRQIKKGEIVLADIISDEDDNTQSIYFLDLYNNNAKPGTTVYKLLGELKSKKQN